MYEHSQVYKKYLTVTSAMAENITDHIWSLKELLTLRIRFNNLGT